MPRTTDTDGAIFEQLRPRLKAISYRIVGSEAEAEDIVQDCYFKWHLAEQSALETPAAWLTTVVQHQSIDRLRKRSRDAVATLTAMELVPEVASASPEDSLLRRAELGEAFARLLSRLTPSERLALVLRDVFECDHADIAAALGTSMVNARQHLARTRRRLREEQQEPSPDEKLCRALIQRFQAALNDLDRPAIATLLASDQPISVACVRQLKVRTGASANDASYHLAMAA